MSAGLLESKDGIKRAAEFIREFRSLSGLDGLELSRFKLRDLVLTAIERYEVLNGAGKRAAILFVDDGADYAIYCNKYIVQSILGRIWTHILTMDVKVNISIGLLDERLVLIHAIREGHLDPEGLDAMSTKAKYLASTAKVGLEFELTEGLLRVFFSEEDIHTMAA
jgi:hypothetical protein